MEPFVKVFGNITVDKIALLIAAIFFFMENLQKSRGLFFQTRLVRSREGEKNTGYLRSGSDVSEMA